MDARVGGVTPERLLTLSDVELREDGFSRQKTRYARALSEALLDGSLDLEALCSLDDAGVRETLVALPGIGPWTAEVYSSALRRPDTWPIGDIGAAGGGAARTGHRRASVGGRAGADRERWRPQRRHRGAPALAPLPLRARTRLSAKRRRVPADAAVASRRGSSRRRQPGGRQRQGAAARSEQRGRADTCENGGVAPLRQLSLRAGRPRQQPRPATATSRPTTLTTMSRELSKIEASAALPATTRIPARVTPRPVRAPRPWIGASNPVAYAVAASATTSADPAGQVAPATAIDAATRHTRAAKVAIAAARRSDDEGQREAPPRLRRCGAPHSGPRTLRRRQSASSASLTRRSASSLCSTHVRVADTADLASQAGCLQRIPLQILVLDAVLATHLLHEQLGIGDDLEVVDAGFDRTSQAGHERGVLGDVVRGNADRLAACVQHRAVVRLENVRERGRPGFPRAPSVNRRALTEPSLPAHSSGSRSIVSSHGLRRADQEACRRLGLGAFEIIAENIADMHDARRDPCAEEGEEARPRLRCRRRRVPRGTPPGNQRAGSDPPRRR